MKKRIMQIAMVGILAITSVFTIGQLTVGAQDVPLCHALPCNSPSDCGTPQNPLCFCNTPTASCIANQ